MVKHRLKRQELVESLFFLFSQEYDSREQESIMDIRIPIDQVIEYLQDKFSVSYSGNQWIFTQIRNYEDEIGSQLFEKEKSGDSRYFLKLNPRMETFSQKKHLYVSQKIKVSNGLYDLIINTPGLSPSGRAVRLLLGAGSTVYHLADIIADRSEDQTDRKSLKYDIYTQNISVLNRFLESRVNHDRIRVFSPGGSMDPVTNSIIGSYGPLFDDVSFDYIIQGTSFLSEGLLYVEQPRETSVKREILSGTKGNKVLILTGHEVRPEIPVQTDPFGKLTDFDTLVIPNNREGVVKNIDRMLLDQEKVLTPEIINWNYRIYRISSR